MSGNSLSSAVRCQSDINQQLLPIPQAGSMLQSGQKSDVPTPAQRAQTKMDKVHPVYPPLKKLQGPITLAKLRSELQKRARLLGLGSQGEHAKQGAEVLWLAHVLLTFWVEGSEPKIKWLLPVATVNNHWEKADCLITRWNVNKEAEETNSVGKWEAKGGWALTQ